MWLRHMSRFWVGMGRTWILHRRPRVLVFSQGKEILNGNNSSSCFFFNNKEEIIILHHHCCFGSYIKLPLPFLMTSLVLMELWLPGCWKSLTQKIHSWTFWSRSVIITQKKKKKKRLVIMSGWVNAKVDLFRTYIYMQRGNRYQVWGISFKLLVVVRPTVGSLSPIQT